MCVCVRARVRARACVRACVCVCVMMEYMDLAGGHNHSCIECKSHGYTRMCYAVASAVAKLFLVARAGQ